MALTIGEEYDPAHVGSPRPMNVVRWIGFAAGIWLVLWTWGSVLRSLIIPRGLSSSLTKTVSNLITKAFLVVSNRFEDYETKDRILALQAPAFLLGSLVTWLVLFLIGFALMLWPLVQSEGGFVRALIESGSAMFTLGAVATATGGPSIVHFLAAATGLVVVALQIAYLPTLYSAFNRRETLVTMLQSRAGSPAWGPEILARHTTVALLDRLGDLYSDWEEWAADVSESHTNYPVLVFFRSPHPLRSWILGLLAVMDSAAMHLALNPSSAPTQARLCVRMGFLCLRHVADFFRIPYDADPFPDEPIELTYEEFHGGVRRLEEVGFPMERSPEEAWPHFRGWRVNYESLAYTLADLVVAPPGPWSGHRSHIPGMAIVPQRPADRRPDRPVDDRAKGQGLGH